MVAFLLVALIAAWAISAASESLPSGVTGGAGPDTGGSITLRDIEGRSLTLPGGREGVIVFITTRGCSGCVGTTRAVDAAARAQPSPLAVTIVSVDSDESKEDFERFDRKAGGLKVRYALDDSSNSIASQYGVRDVNTVLAYTDQGLTTQLIQAGPNQVARMR